MMLSSLVQHGPSFVKPFGSDLRASRAQHPEGARCSNSSRSVSQCPQNEVKHAHPVRHRFASEILEKNARGEHERGKPLEAPQKHSRPLSHRGL